MFKKIMKMRSIQQSWGGWNEVLVGVKFSIKKAYEILFSPQPCVPWKSVICNGKAAPIALFTIWMLAHMKLASLDRIGRWVHINDSCCRLRGNSSEFESHLFGNIVGLVS